MDNIAQILNYKFSKGVNTPTREKILSSKDGTPEAQKTPTNCWSFRVLTKVKDCCRPVKGMFHFDKETRTEEIATTPVREKRPNNNRNFTVNAHPKSAAASSISNLITPSRLSPGKCAEVITMKNCISSLEECDFFSEKRQNIPSSEEIYERSNVGNLFNDSPARDNSSLESFLALEQQLQREFSETNGVRNILNEKNAICSTKKTIPMKPLLSLLDDSTEVISPDDSLQCPSLMDIHLENPLQNSTFCEESRVDKYAVLSSSQLVDLQDSGIENHHNVL